MEIQTVSSLEELRKGRRPIRNINIEHREHLTRLERFAAWITGHVGTMGFFLIIFLWTTLWLSWNVFTPEQYHFDPYPAFVFWLFISNMIQIFLMPLIMIGQNLQGRHAEARAESDYEVNMKSAEEIETILAHLEAQRDTLNAIKKQLEGK